MNPSEELIHRTLSWTIAAAILAFAAGAIGARAQSLWKQCLTETK